MKYPLLILLLVAVLLTAGCTNENKNVAITPAVTNQPSVPVATTTQPALTTFSPSLSQTVPSTTTVISTIPKTAGSNVCVRGGNGFGSEFFYVIDPGVRTFTITHVRGFDHFILLNHTGNEREPYHSIRYLAWENGLEKNEDICYNTTKTYRLYVSGEGRYWTRNDYVTLNTTEFLDAGTYFLDINTCGPWTIKITPCTEQGSNPSNDAIIKRSIELVRGKPVY